MSIRLLAQWAVLISTFSVLLLVASSSVRAADATDYLTEFGNAGETCRIADFYAFRELNPTWYSDNHYIERVPVWYQCCNGDQCTNVVVDIQGQTLLRDDTVGELIDLNYIKGQLQSGNLSQMYFVSDGMSVCSFYSDAVQKQTANLAADTAEKIAQMHRTELAKDVVTGIELARTAEIVSPFSIADFSAGVACSYSNGKVKKAVETLGRCNAYLGNIQNNVAQTGDVAALDSCFTEAKADLKAYLDDTVAQVKNIIDIIFTFFGGLFKMAGGDTKANPLADTEYAVAQKIYNSIKDKQGFLHHPNHDVVFQKYAARITQKESDYRAAYNTVAPQVTLLDAKVPSWIGEFITNALEDPNFQPQTREVVGNLTRELTTCEALHKAYRYNSAIACLNSTQAHYAAVQEGVYADINAQRHWDWLAIGLLIILGVLCFIGIKKFVVGNDRADW